MEIDYVVPMVFPDDDKWLEDYNKYKNVLYLIPRTHPRFRSWGTEHLLIRCIKTFMPWVRTIHILLARESQIQPWMKQEGVHVVLHRHFIPARYLPVFNSCTIEMFIPRIEGLAEHFIYGNDDMFPLSPLKEEDFFKDGLPCIHFEKMKFPEKLGLFHKKCIRQQNMVASAFNKRFTEGLWLYGGHNLAPMLLSSCKEARERFSNEIEKGITRKRSVTSYNQYLYTLWLFFTKRYVKGNCPRSYVSLGDTIDKIHKTILKPDVGLVCINDSDDKNDFQQYAKSVRSFLSEKLLSYHSNSDGQRDAGS